MIGGRATAVWSAGCAVMFSLLLAGCPQGYPTKDRPLLDQELLTAVQRLEAMNRLAGGAGTTQALRYRLIDACTLDVGAQRPVALQGLGISVRSDRSTGRHMVVGELPVPQPHPLELYSGPDWPDAVEFSVHVRGLQADCVAERFAKEL